jgi:Cytochrome c554 and c-prime
VRKSLSGLASWACLAALGAVAAGAAGTGCSSQPASTFLSREDMIQPSTCAQCHVNHFNDWTESMHAKASDDPVFLAMNKRGQRETGGKLGKFCVQCHAPMAVRDGKTTDGLNLGDLPSYYKGVTCFFCHTIDSVGASHNNASVNLSGDLVMRGEISEHSSPALVSNPAHASAYSTFHDSAQKDSATMCGSCHDIDSPAGGHIERTFEEWSESAFPTPVKGSTCNTDGCHMTEGPVQIPIATGGPKRSFHAHNFPAVDVPLETNVDTEGGAPTLDGGDPAATTAVQNALNGNALQGALCVTAQGGIRVLLDTAGVGHNWPSGAAQDRRAWAEVIAFDANGGVIYQSGVVPDGMPVTSIDDPDLWLLRDCMFDAQSKPVVNFWEAAKTSGYELPPLLTFNPSDPRFFQSHILQTFPRSDPTHPFLKSFPARVTVRIRIQAIGLDVLQDLVDSGDLDPSVVAKMPTFDVSLQGPFMPGGLEWTPASDDTEFMDEQGPTKCATSPGGFNVGTRTQGTSAATCPAPMP